MNVQRALIVANIFGLATGYHLHWLDTNKKEFRYTLFSVLAYLSWLVYYIFSAHTHFRKAILLDLVEALSPMTREVMRAHMIIGIKITACILYDAKGFADILTRVLRTFSRPNPRFRKEELLVYFFLFSNIFVEISVGITDLVLLHLKRFYFQHARVGSAMFLPHFAVACVLKYLCIFMWLIKIEFGDLRVQIKNILNSTYKNGAVITVEDTVINNFELTVRQYDSGTDDMAEDLKNILKRLEDIKQLALDFNQKIQKQLSVLIVQNVVVCVGGAIGFMNYDIKWKYFLFGDFSTVFLLSYGSIFLFVYWDYMCLFLTATLLEYEKQSIGREIDIYLQCTNYSKPVVKILRKMKSFMEEKTYFSIMRIFDLDMKTFFVLNSQIASGIAIFIVFRYYNDKLEILQLSSQM